MPKIAFIGAGSYGFTRRLVKDILTFPALRGSTLALMDINDERLDFARRSVERIVREGNYPATILATKDRKEALKGADAVLCTILAAPVSVWRHDIEIPKQFGVDINIGDTRGPSGIFRALRTIPVMLDICRDMERLCPDAILLNYTNPMAMLCRAMQRKSPLRITGLCHSVQGTAEMLAQWIGAPMDEITYTCAGINHQAWYLRYDWNRKDAIPLIRKAVGRQPQNLQRGAGPQRDVPAPGLLRHRIERAQLRIQLVVPQAAGPDPQVLHHRHGLESRPLRLHREVLPRSREELAAEMPNSGSRTRAPLDLKRGHEYAASIINAYLGGGPFLFNGNVPNTGLITNLPHGACVEVPVYADRNGFNPVHVGALPPQLRRAQQRQRRGRGDGRRGGAHRRPAKWSSTPSPTTRSPPPSCLWRRYGRWWTRCSRRTRTTCRSSKSERGRKENLRR